MRYYLEPFGPGDNILRRVNLYGATGPEGVMLGRNEQTGLIDTNFPNFQYVSRRHVLVRRRGDQVFIHPHASQEGVVYLNGQQCNNVEVELRVNDCFSMLGVKNYYNYTLKIDNADPLQAAARAVPAPAVLVNILDQSVSSVENDHDRPISIHSSSSSGDGSSSSSSILIIPSSSQPGALSPPPLRTQSVEVVDLNTTSVDIIAPSIPSAAAISSAARLVPVVVLEPAPAAPVAPAVPAVDPAELERSITKGIVSKMLRQYECSICYETLACAVSLHPCGCCFCYTCIADWANETKKPSATGEVQCPLCQADFLLSNALSNRTVDSAVREVLQNIPSELSAWETRMQEGNERRRQAEASLGANNKSSSSTSLTSLAGLVAAANGARSANGAVQSNGTSGSVRTNGASGLSRNDVVELLDSQPDPYAAFYPSVRANAPAAQSRPRDIQSFFGRAAAAPAASTAVPVTSTGTLSAALWRGGRAGSDRVGAGANAGFHNMEAVPPDLANLEHVNERKRSRWEKAEERENAMKRRLARLVPGQSLSTNDSSSSNTINNINNTGATAGQTAAAPGLTSTTATSTATPATGAVFDLTAVSSPAARRLAAATPPRARSSASVLASAVAAPAPAPTHVLAGPIPAAAPARAPAPAPAAVPAAPGNGMDPSNGEGEFFCVMPVTDLSSAISCTSCTRSFRTLNSALGIFNKLNSHPRKPVSKQDWLAMCTDWRCPLCIVSFNNERRRAVRERKKLVDYQGLELKENLNHSEKMTWYNILQV